MDLLETGIRKPKQCIIGRKLGRNYEKNWAVFWFKIWLIFSVEKLGHFWARKLTPFSLLYLFLDISATVRFNS